LEVLYSIPLVIKTALSIFANDRNNMGSLHPMWWKINWRIEVGGFVKSPWVFYSKLNIIIGGIRKIMRVWNSKAINYSIRFCGNCVNGKERGLERVSLGKYFAVFLIHIETQFYMWELSQPISFQISQYLPMNLEKLRLCNRRILYPSFYAAYTFISMRYLRKLAIDC